MSSIFEWISVGANIASILGLFITLKQYNMKAVFQNPYLKVFGASLIFTAFVFLIPWKRIHIDNEAAVQKLTVIHDTTTKTVYKTVPETKKEKINKTLILDHKTKIGYAPINSSKTLSSKALDTSVKTQTNLLGKYEINTNSGTNNGNIGGSNNTVNNGIQQREVNDAVISYITTSIPNKNTRISITCSNDKESRNFCNYVGEFFYKNGYRKPYAEFVLYYDSSDNNKLQIHRITKDSIHINILPLDNIK